MRQFAMRVLALAVVMSMAGLVEAAGKTTTTTTIKGTIVGLEGKHTKDAVGHALFTKTVVRDRFGVRISHSAELSVSIKNLFLPDGTQVDFFDVNSTTGTTLIGTGVMNNGKVSVVLRTDTGAKLPVIPEQGDLITVFDHATDTIQYAEGLFGEKVITTK